MGSWGNPPTESFSNCDLNEGLTKDERADIVRKKAGAVQVTGMYRAFMPWNNYVRKL